MTRITIPASELPNISEDSLSHLRFRVIDENRKLFSAYSVISAVKRTPFEFISEDYNSLFQTSTASNKIDLTWYTDNISQKFEIYARYRYMNSSSATYWEEPTYFGSSSINSFSFIPTPILKTATSTLTSRSVQALIKIPTYSPTVYNKNTISNLSRGVDGIATYTTTTDHGLIAGDVVSIYLNISASTVFDTFAGYFSVISAPTSTTFTCNTVSTTAYSGSPPSGSLTNYVQKVSGKVQFITEKINFI